MSYQWNYADFCLSRELKIPVEPHGLTCRRQCSHKDRTHKPGTLSYAQGRCRATHLIKFKPRLLMPAVLSAEYFNYIVDQITCCVLLASLGHAAGSMGGSSLDCRVLVVVGVAVKRSIFSFSSRSPPYPFSAHAVAHQPLASGRLTSGFAIDV